MRLCAILSCLLLAPKCLESKVVKGYLRTGENWAYLTRFCFLSLHGRFKYEVSYSADVGVQNIDLYYDTPAQWDRVYGRDSNLKSCREKESVLQVENNQFINLTTEMPSSGCEILSSNFSSSLKRIHCDSMRNFNTARDRWWFVAISNCNSSTGVHLNYKFLMTNGVKGDLLHYHFSADEFYILPILLVSFLEHLVILFLCIWSAILLKMRQLLHATYKIFLCAVSLHTLGLALLCAHYLIYAFDGIGAEGAKLNGRILEAAAEVLFILLIILIAKGYTVTRARLRQVSSVKVAIFISLYGITYFVLFVFEQLYFDPGQVLYIYESLAGYGLIALRSCGWFMFIYSTFFTLKHYPEKGGFYYPYFSFYTLWFISGPTIIVISNHVISEWVRQKVVVSVEHFVCFVGHAVFLILTRPNAQNKNFPYHVRTTQIGILQAIESHNTSQPGSRPIPVSDSNTLDNFSHGGTYGVSNHQSAMDIFTVETVGSRRSFAPSIPPPYTTSTMAAGTAEAAIRPWAENSRRKNSANAVVNGVAGKYARREPNVEQNGTKIYDPNEDDGNDTDS